MKILNLQRKYIISIFLLSFVINIYADEIAFPPEFAWWIYEIKKVNKNVDIDKFKFFEKKTVNFGVDEYYQRSLIYPIFMRWNFSGNTIGYYNYNNTQPRRLASGKYSIGGDFDDLGVLYIADKTKNIFFHDFFGVAEGLNAICWMTDTLLISVGFSVNFDATIDDSTIDLYIINYKIDHTKKTVEKTTFIYKNAFKNSDRDFLKLNWYEHRPDYFELKK